jgi:thiamine biosynthesis lipoprotein
MKMFGLVEITRSFTAMNTNVEAVVCVPSGGEKQAENALLLVQDIFTSVEAALSRFIPDSEISRLNRSAGQPFQASSLLFTVMTLAKAAAETTGGIFDPTILPFLMAAGYDRSFEQLVTQSILPVLEIKSRYTWRDIILDAAASTITIPAGAGVDLGGIAKGWTVDYAGQKLKDFSGFAIDAGGDILLGGKRADGSLWPIGVVDPFNLQENLTVLELSDCAICTSTTTRRRWRLDGFSGHHLIDPRHGKPADSAVVSVTVIADSAARAEVIAKTALILGPDEGMQFIHSQTGAQGIIVLNNGVLLRSEETREAGYVR